MLETVAAAGGGGIGGLAYSESADSSPRSSGGEFWDKPPFPSPAAGRLRLMCSYGGRIVPRPNSKSLRYLGGETRIVVVDRYSSLADLSAKLSRTLLGGCPFSLRYQLPNEDLDSLISVATEDDLNNMIEEYDRIIASDAAAGSRTSRLRLFLFPSKTEVSPTSSVGSLLDDSKSDTWFVDALNSALGGMGIDFIPRGRSSDSSSVNCLLGLEDDPSDHSHGDTATASAGGGGVEQSERTKRLVLPHSDSSSKHDRPIHEVHSVPGSPMLDMSSSFGSASSAPSLSSLPPLCLRPDDRPSEPRIADLDERYAQMNISAAASAAGSRRLDDDLLESPYTPHLQLSLSSPLSTSSNSTATITPNDNPDRAFSSDDDKSNHIGNQKLPLQPPTSTLLEIPFSNSSSRLRYSNITVDPKSEPVSSLPSYHAQVPATDAAGYPSPPTTEQFQHQQLLPQIHTQQQQQQQQYIPANPHYIHHPGTGGVIPVPTFFPVGAHTIHQPPQTHHPYDPQIPLYYYYPVQQTPQYNLGTLQSGLGDPNLVSSAGIPALPAPLVPPKSELPTSLYGAAATPQPPLIHLAADQARPYTGMVYRVVQQQLSQTPATMPKFDYEISAKHQPVSAGVISDAMMPVDAKVTRGL